MRAAKMLAALAIAALGISSFSAVALAGKQKKTIVQFQRENGLTFNSGKVTARGSLRVKFPVSQPGERCGSRCQASRSRWLAACQPSRSMRLQVLDTNGVVLTTLDGSTSANGTSGNGRWILSGQLPTTLPAGTNYVRVRAKKRTVGKFVCQAGVSTLAIPAV
jgi:hypothetical protein